MLANKSLARCFATYRSKVAIIGSGTGGLAVSTQLLRQGVVKPSEMLIVDSTAYHCYHGYSTMIAGGFLGDTDKSVNKRSREFYRPTREIFPKDVNILPSLAKTFYPELNKFVIENGDEVFYEYLVVSPGLRHNFEIVEGAKEALADPNSKVASIFDGLFGGRKMNRLRTELTKGVAVFANSPQPAKCGGAPLKTCFLVEDYLRKIGIRKNVEIHFFNAGNLLFPVPKYGAILDKLVKERNIITHYNMLLTKIDKDQKVATFVSMTDKTKTQEIQFDCLHIASHFVPLSKIKASPFANNEGFLEVDLNTLQHVKYKNVFCLGDAAEIPTSKTAAAITVQAPVVVHNIGNMLKGKKPTAKYSGYSVCPIFSGRDRMLFCETLYKEPYHSYFQPNDRPKWVYYFVSRYLMPLFYWWFIPRGMWYGKRFLFKPRFD